MTASVLQESFADDSFGSGTTIATPSTGTGSFGASCTVGSTIVVFVTCSHNTAGNAILPSSVVDSASQTYVHKKDAHDTAGDQGLAVYVFQNNASATKLTVTATFAAAQTGKGLWVGEIGGVTSTAYDNADAASKDTPGTGANAVTGNSITPTNSPTLCYSIGMECSIGNGSDLAAGTGYTLTGTTGWKFGGSVVLAKSQFKRLTSVTSTAATWTAATNGASGGYLIGLVMLDEAASSGALAGTASITFGQSGVLTGAGALAGSSAITFGQSGALKGSGALAGSSAVVFGQSGALTATGALAATAAVTFGQSGVLGGFGTLAGSSAIVFSASGALVQPSMQGAASVTFGAAATLQGLGQLAGTAGITFGTSATLAGAGALNALAAVTFGANGTLAASGSLVGSSAIVFDASGTMVRPGALAGTAAIAFDGTASITAMGVLSGAAAITFDSSGSFGTTQPAGKHRKRYGVMDGWRLQLFNSKSDADAYRAALQQRSAQPKKALKRIRTVEPAQTINLPELKRSLPPPQAAKVDQMVRERQYERIAQLPHIAAQYEADRQAKERAEVDEVAHVVAAHRQASIAHIQSIHQALKVLTEIRRLRSRP